ncbi:hypothetical protein FRC12_013551 [Ceratobasidium sp. 428]|nr:hypothetical protein FRC12_013551 [Ceratobasidium sp. 428]
MAAAHTLTENEVAIGLHSCLVPTLKDAKRNGVLEDTDLVGGDEQWLVIYSLALHLLYSAKSETMVPSIELPGSEDSGRRFNALTCPPEFRPYFDRWASLVSGIQPLPQDYTHDLALLICRKSPITLPKELPDPMPFFPTPEQQAREDIRELSSKLNMISNAISEHGPFSLLWRGKLCAALSEESRTSTGKQVPDIITSDMALPQIIAILTEHSCPNITRKLDSASCSTAPLARGGSHEIYKGAMRDGSPVAIRRPQFLLWSPEAGYLTFKEARGAYTWSKCHHPNVQPLFGIATFRNRLSTVSPWMDNGNVVDYVNKQPGADRFNICTQITCGLAYLHSIGIMHGNLKGSKILVSDLGVPMLGNFSNCISSESIIQFEQMENDYGFNVRWAAPERFWENAAPSTVVDVYSLGMVILEVFTGKVPYYYIASDRGVMNKRLTEKEIPQRPSEISLDDSQGDMLWSLMKKCWQYKPEERPTAEQVYKTMKPFVIDSTMVASEIIAHLGSRNCPDLTDQLEHSSCGQYPLSRGGYGEVYQGVLNSGQPVALKSIILQIGSSRSEKELLKDTARELHVWSKCKNENVVQLLGLAVFRNQIAMVSPWMKNGDMMSYIKRDSSVNRYRLCTEVAQGLAYLHQTEMVHGDLKAANVLISDHGVAMLTDFGNAILTLSTVQFAGTQSECKMSLRWAAPELMLEGGKHSRQADVYALGMTILVRCSAQETLTGEVPFPKKRNDAQVVYAVMVLKEKPERPGSISADSRVGEKLWDLLTRCWAHGPAERPLVSEVRDTVHTSTPLLQNCLVALTDFIDADNHGGGSFGLSPLTDLLRRSANTQSTSTMCRKKECSLLKLK